MKNIIMILACLSAFISIPSLSNADVKVDGLLNIEQGGGIKFYDGTMFSSKGITGPMGLTGADGTSVTSIVLPVGNANCPTGGIQYNSASGINYVCNGAEGLPAKYGKVAVVAQTNGDYPTPSAALTDVATWCGISSAVSPCLVKIMPGKYDVGATPLAMLDFVDMEGSGETNTIISGSIDSITSGVINGARATLSKLTVTNPGGVNAQNAVAVFNTSPSFQLLQATARATGAVSTFALYNTGMGTLKANFSNLDALGLTLFNGSTASAVSFGTTFIDGKIINNGKLACNASRNGMNNFYDSTCPSLSAFQIIGYMPSQYYSPLTQSNVIIRVIFSNDMNPATITTSTFTIHNNMTNEFITGTVQYDPTSRAASFVLSPSQLLVSNSYYSVTITTDVTDKNGSRLTTPFTWQFSTGNVSIDTTPPVVTSVMPSDKSTGIPVVTSIYAQFGEGVDDSSGQIKLVDSNGTTVYTGLGSGVLNNPNAPLTLTLGMTYTVTVSGVKDFAGNVQGAPYSWTFTTTPITSPTGVMASSSAGGATVSWQPVTGATGYNLYWAPQTYPASTPTKISNITSPYTFTPQLSMPFTGTLNIYATTPTAIGSGQFTMTIPAGVAVTSVYGGAANFTQAGTKVAISYNNQTDITSSSLLHVLFTGDFTGKSQDDFTFSDIHFVDWSGTPINGTHLSTNGTNSSTYSFYVTAINASGESPPSTSVSATIDPYPPLVVGSRPHGSININQNNDIQVSFSEVIDMQNVTSATYAVTANGTPLNGSYYYYSSNYNFFSVGYSLTSGFQQGTNYTVTVSGIKDMAGNTLQVPYSWSFTIPISAPTNLVATKDGLQSTLYWQPVSGASSYNIYWSTVPGVTPQNGTKISGVTGSTYTHTGLTNGATYYYVVTAVNGAVEGVPSNQVSVLIEVVGTPSNLMATRGDHQATLTWNASSPASSYNLYWSHTNGVTKGNGTKIAGVSSPYVHQGLTDNTDYYYVVTAVSSGFESPDSNQAQVRIDSVPPTVIWTIPASNATSVPINESVCANFSENIDGNTLNPSTFMLKDNNGNYIAGSQGGNCIYFPYMIFLKYNTTYTAIITTGVKDMAGNPLASNYSWSFRTILPNPMDLVASRGNLETSLSWTPVAGASSYSIYWSTSPGVSKQNGVKITGITTSSYTHSGLANGSYYYYVVTAVSGGSESSESNQVSVSFDFNSPIVTSTDPNGTDIYPTWRIIVYFNEELEPSTVNTSTMYLKDADGNLLSAFVFLCSKNSYPPGFGYCLLNINDEYLKFGTTYTLTATTALKDLSGNNMAADYIWTFKTEQIGVPNIYSIEDGVGQVTLTWNQVSGASSYNVYWSTTPGVDILTASKINGAMSPFTQTGLSAGTTYYFVVTAINGSMESAVSNEASVTVQ
jgi:hypothetical protein